MIKISIDEAAAFDILSILEVKTSKNHDKKFRNLYLKLLKEIKDQIGNLKTNEILKSKDYQDLLRANENVFELVDLAKKNRVSAKDMDLANYKRFVLKTAIQQKYFNKNLTETKIGYE